MPVIIPSKLHVGISSGASVIISLEAAVPEIKVLQLKNQNFEPFVKHEYSAHTFKDASILGGNSLPCLVSCVVVPLVDGKEELLNETHASVFTDREFYVGIPQD
jgi:hypothetical protein